VTERIGFIGLGIMGRPMANNLLKAGFALTAHNRSRAPVDELVAAGARAAGSPREVAAACDLVITMLPDTPDVETVVLGADGVLAGAAPGALLVDLSTIAPGAARRLAEEAARRGVGMLDAPVSGGEPGAIAGSLSIMVGGGAADFERAWPVFAALGKTITHCGPSGAGQTVKACNQVVVALVIEAVAEALVLGSKAGVRPEVILQVLGGGLAQTRVMDLRGPTMVRHEFAPGFKARLHRKDLGIILRTARELGVTLPVTALVDQLFASLVEGGGGELDHSALLTVLEDLSHHQVGEDQSPPSLREG
jgi:2-hydroxy-3-oxopropionate reductase